MDKSEREKVKNWKGEREGGRDRKLGGKKRISERNISKRYACPTESLPANLVVHPRQLSTDTPHLEKIT